MEVNEKRKRKSRKKQKKTASGYATRKIPKAKLENALKILQSDEEFLDKRGSGCEPGIHNYKQACVYNQEPNDISNIMLRLKYAQICLLRRDWRNLAKLILLFKPDKSNYQYLPLFVKYASICLAYTNQPLLKMLLQSYNCNEPLERVLTEWTSLPDVK